MTDEARAPEQTVEPRTEAGRALLAAIFEEEGGMPVDPGSAILAIEREAAAVAAPPLDVERLAEAYDIVMMKRGRAGMVPLHIFQETVAEYAALSQPSPDEPTR